MTDAISSREAYIRACRDYCALLREERTAEEKHKTPSLEKDYLNKLVENAAHYVWEEMHSHFANKFRSERKPEDYAQAAHLRRHQATIIKRAVKSADFQACVEDRVFGNYEMVSKHCETLLSDPNPRELKDQAVRIGLEKLRDRAWPLWNRDGIVPAQDSASLATLWPSIVAGAMIGGLTAFTAKGCIMKDRQHDAPGGDTTSQIQAPPSDEELGKPPLRDLRGAAKKDAKDLPPKPPSPQR